MCYTPSTIHQSHSINVGSNQNKPSSEMTFMQAVCSQKKKTKEILRVTFSSPALLRQLKAPRGDSQCPVWGRKPAARGLSCWGKAERSLNQSTRLIISLQQPQSWPITPKHSPLAQPLFPSSSHSKASGLVCSTSLFHVSDCLYTHSPLRHYSVIALHEPHPLSTNPISVFLWSSTENEVEVGALYL